MSLCALARHKTFIIFVLIASSLYVFISLNYKPTWHTITSIDDRKHELNHKIIQYLNFTDDIRNISINNAECGRIWLYHNKGLILSIDSISNHTVYIKNISPYKQTCNAARITLYITIHGTEFVGGLAIPHSTKCAWYYTYKIRVSGNYTINARLLYYDGILDPHYKRCNASLNYILYNKSTTHIDSKGVYHDKSHILQRISRDKFYEEHEQCCEWCARLPNCAYYISQNTRVEVTKINRCIMFNETAVHNMQLIHINQIAATQYSFDANVWIIGQNRKEQTKYYLGCLAPTTTTQRKYCHHKQYDMIHNSDQYVTLQNNNNINSQQHKPFCAYSNIQTFEGSWLKLATWSGGYWQVSACTMHSLYCNVPAFFSPYHCIWRYNNSAQILRDLYHIYAIRRISFPYGDSILGNMMRSMQILFPKQSFECDDADHEQQNGSVLLCGRCKVYVKKYLGRRRRRRRLTAIANKSLLNGTAEIMITNLKLVHRLWHNSIADIHKYLHQMYQGFKTYFRAEYGNNTNNWPRMVVLELPMIVSEREYHCTAPRVVMVNQLIHQIFANKTGWNIFPLFKLTESMQYDFSENNDGLHPDSFVNAEIIRILLEFLVEI